MTDIDIDPNQVLEDNVLSDKELEELAGQKCNFDNSHLWNLRETIELELRPKIEKRKAEFSAEAEKLSLF